MALPPAAQHNMSTSGRLHTTPQHGAHRCCLPACACAVPSVSRRAQVAVCGCATLAALAAAACSVVAFHTAATCRGQHDDATAAWCTPFNQHFGMVAASASVAAAATQLVGALLLCVVLTRRHGRKSVAGPPATSGAVAWAAAALGLVGYRAPPPPSCCSRLCDRAALLQLEATHAPLRRQRGSGENN